MRVDGAPPPTTWSAAHGAPPRPPAADGAAERAGAPGGVARPLAAPSAEVPAAASRPVRDAVDVGGAQQPPSSPWLERASQVAGAGRGSASGALGLDVVV